LKQFLYFSYLILFFYKFHPHETLLVRMSLRNMHLS